MNYLNGVLILLLLTFAGSCVEPYETSETTNPPYVIIINAALFDHQSSFVEITKAKSLKDTLENTPVNNAVVTMEREDGQITRFFMSENKYYPAFSDLDLTKKYRLRIVIEAKEYMSEYIQPTKSPAIDEISWEAKSEGVQIFVTTHDPQARSKYYKWDYIETFEFTSAYFSSLVWNAEIGILDDRHEDIYKCYRTEESTNISIFSTAALKEDVVYKFPLLFIPYDSYKLGRKYRIEVIQKVLPKEAFEFWELLRKNFENLGTIFAPLPSQVTGNIKCTSEPNDNVIGLFSITLSSSKTIFIKNKDLPAEWKFISPYDQCDLDTILLRRVNEVFGRGISIPVGPVYSKGLPVLIGYTGGSAECIDCRLKGTNQKPPFWDQ